MRPAPHGARAGFTLAEIAVTIVIVTIALTLVLQGLVSSRSTAAHSNNRKVAMELALYTISRVEAGMFWEDLDGLTGNFEGTYAEEGYEAFRWELIIGDDEFRDREVEEDDPNSPYFDNLAHRRQQLAEDEAESGDTEDEAYPETGTTGGPFERVTIRVTFPKLTDLSNELVLERWVPLDQVFGQSDEEIAASDSGGQNSSGGGR